MIFDWRNARRRRIRRRRRNANQVELVFGPGDGLITETELCSILYRPDESTNIAFLYERDESDTYATYARAFYRGKVEMTVNEAGEQELWLVDQ